MTWMMMTRMGDQVTSTPPSTICRPCQGSDNTHILTNSSDNNKNMTWSSKYCKVVSLNLLTLHKLVFVPGSEPQQRLCPNFSHLSLLIAVQFLPPSPLHIIISYLASLQLCKSLTLLCFYPILDPGTRFIPRHKLRALLSDPSPFTRSRRSTRRAVEQQRRTDTV